MSSTRFIMASLMVHSTYCRIVLQIVSYRQLSVDNGKYTDQAYKRFEQVDLAVFTLEHNPPRRRYLTKPNASERFSRFSDKYGKTLGYLSPEKSLDTGEDRLLVRRRLGRGKDRFRLCIEMSREVRFNASQRRLLSEDEIVAKT